MRLVIAEKPSVAQPGIGRPGTVCCDGAKHGLLPCGMLQANSAALDFFNGG